MNCTREIRTLTALNSIGQVDNITELTQLLAHRASEIPTKHSLHAFRALFFVFLGAQIVLPMNCRTIKSVTELLSATFSDPSIRPRWCECE